ncbi:MAG TPA: hypothetical protein VL284_16050 [Thermoanaerobaculia bacterium]|nr:hypothetical protein [Thermoanaerobaculia bacterium]
MRSLFLALALVLSSTTLFAQNWRDELHWVDRDLKNQDYAQARKWSIKVINSMCDHLGTGPDAMYSLATAVAYRAMAEAGLEKPEDADWYAHVAFALWPKLADQDWSAYGDAGVWLSAKKHQDDITPDANAPVRLPLKKEDPKCPLSAVAGAYYQPVTVSAVVDDDGVARCPALVSQTNAPTLVYAAFESLKNFQFPPGPPAKYQVTVNFKPPKS